MEFIYSYSNKMNFESAILEYSFTPNDIEWLESLIPFEKEDSEFAPEPSVGCGLKADDGQEFGLIFLRNSRHLLVFSEETVIQSAAARIFRKSLPALTPMEVPVTFITKNS